MIANKHKRLVGVGWTKHLLKYHLLYQRRKLSFREVKVQGHTAGGGAEKRVGCLILVPVLLNTTLYLLCVLSVERALKTSRLMADDMHRLYPGSDNDI